MKRFQLNGFPAFSVELKDGTTVAYLDYCPHKGRPITANGFKLDDDTIICPFHGAIFDLKDGSLARPPVSKAPCPPKCALIKVILNPEPVGFESEPKMPKLPGEI